MPAPSPALPRMTTLFLPHGGGPWPWMPPNAFMDAGEYASLFGYLQRLPSTLPAPPRALLVVSAHWEAPVPTVMTSLRPPLLFDYYGFPPETYALTWPAPGAPELAATVRQLLAAAGISSAEDAARGFDHGTFVPLAVSFPQAEVPTLQLSLKQGLDPATHLAIGRALAPLRDQGVCIVGSGMSFHNLREWRLPSTPGASRRFDDWLRQVIVDAPEARDAALTRWASAPEGRRAHPREEHLLPLLVVAGAAGADRGRVDFSGTVGRAAVSAARFGA